jgi:hypothetical protein
VICGYRNIWVLVGSLNEFLYVDCSGNVQAAVADKYADSLHH